MNGCVVLDAHPFMRNLEIDEHFYGNLVTFRYC